jgi:uncharacterized protein with beta-barrel porin domain
MVKSRMLTASLVIGIVVGAALVAAPIAPSGTPQESEDDGGSVRGAGTTMVEGGTGSPSFAPIITKVAFHWRAGAGSFECLALAPTEAAGTRGSGKFDTNIMYVTGAITSAEIDENAAVLKGSATVTGAGAGSDQAFTATVTRGGPGATLVLEVSGLTFREILLDGRFTL